MDRDSVPTNICNDLRREYEFERQLAEGEPSTRAKFNFAWTLVKSEYDDEIDNGIRMMMELLDNPEDINEYIRDIHYFLSIGHTKRRRYDQARNSINWILLEMDMSDQQAWEMKRYLDRVQWDESVVGKIAKVGPSVAAFAIGMLSGIAVTVWIKK